MGKIRNVFIKQHQRGRWRYLSLLAQSVGARFPACALFHQKTLQKLTALYLLLGHALGNARQYRFS